MIGFVIIEVDTAVANSQSHNGFALVGFDTSPLNEPAIAESQTNFAKADPSTAFSEGSYEMNLH